MLTKEDIRQALEAELQRLFACDISQDNIALARRYYSDAERQGMDESDFCGPNRSFPITSQEDVDSAAHLIGHATDQAAVRRCIVEKAKANGWSIPEGWQESNDTGERHALYMPITYMSRREDDEWIVEGQATAEVPDSFGTIFTYEASKRAFQEWMARYANMREMHDRKAAGKGISVTYDDANKRILLRTRVSKGAPDTWLKFHEGVLNGFSVGPDKNYKMGRMMYQGKSYPAIIEYHLAEVSYVDAPSCPGSDAYIVARADGNLSDLIDDSEPEPTEQPLPTTPATTTQEAELLERAGARLSSGSRATLHSMRDQAMQLCGCEECGDMMNRAAEPDQRLTEQMHSLLNVALERALSPVYQRQQNFLARLAQFDTHYAAIEQQLAEMTRLQGQLSQLDEIKAVLGRVATASTLDEVRANLLAVEGRVKVIEDTPAPGGPVLNGARPYDKSNPYSPQTSTTDRSQIERETIERLSASGAFKTVEDQVAAAALLMQPIPMRF